MNLSERLKLLEAHHEHFYEDRIKGALEFIEYMKGQETLDKTFRACLKSWHEKKDVVYQMGLNILLYLMAIANTHEYRRIKGENKLETLAAEVDADYTPNYFQGLLESNAEAIPNELRNHFKSKRAKTTIRRASLEAGHYYLRKKDEKYAVIEDVFKKTFILSH